jgi:putative ABC transport system permease protein
MIALMFGALRSRGAQTVTVMVLAVLAVAAAAAAPWYVLAADNAALVNEVRSAPAQQRLFSASRGLTANPDFQASLATFAATVRDVLDVPGSASYLGLYQMGRYQAPGVDVAAPLAYRDQVCAHVTVDGTCPQALGEAMVSQRSASMMRVRVGDSITLTPAAGGVRLRITGVYDWAMPTGDYWASSLFGPPTGGTDHTDPVYVLAATFGTGGFESPTGVDDVVLPLDAFRTADLGARVAGAQYELGRQNVQAYQSAGQILNRIFREVQLIDTGVVVGAAQLLVLCWFALYLAGRSTGADRRVDVAMLKLRGATFGRLLRLTAAHTATPILVGVLPGVALGYLAARWLAGPLTEPGRSTLAWELAAGAVLLAVCGAIAAVVVAEWRMLRAPIVDLLRRVPPRHRGWRADVVSLCVVALAVAGAYQVRAQGGVDGSAPGLALLAPGLIALALAVVLARALTYLAGSVGAAALRAGRLRLALGALQVARRPGIDRLFILLAVSVAVVGSAAGAWYTSAHARGVRASVEIGADRQLTVRAADRTELLNAVRTADPSGREAMAVVYNSARSSGSPPVLAVDAARLAQVASWGPGYGPDAATLAALLRQPGPAPLTVTGDTVTMDATLVTPGAVYVQAELSNTRTGETVQPVLGPLAGGRHTYRAASPSCVDGGCRLVSLRLVSAQSQAGGYPEAKAGSSVAVNQIGQLGPDRVVADSRVLTDMRRWRAPFTAAVPNPVLGTAAGRLTVTLPEVPVDAPPLTDGRISVVDVPLPLPAVLTGQRPTDWAIDQPDLTPFGSATVPVRIVGTAAALPQVGGQGILVDLETATRAVGEGSIGDRQEVWLAPDAPADLPDKLRAAGLSILDSDSVAQDLARSAAQGPTAALRFQLLTALVCLLLGAAGLSVVGAAERGPRGVELSALRRQGLSARAARAVGYGGYAALAGLAVLAGLAGTVRIRLLAGSGLPVFADAWTVLPLPTGLHPLPVLLVTGGALVLFGAVALTAGAQVARAVRGGSAR